MNQGAQVLYPFAGAAGLAFNVQTQVTLVPATVLSVAPSNYTWLSLELKRLQTSGRLQVEGGSEVGFYIMNEGNFSAWRRGRPTVVELAQPMAINYNFTIVPRNSGLYYFVFSNQDPTRKNVVLTLNVVESTPIVSPLVQYAGYEALILGLLLCLIAVKTGRRASPESITYEGPKCKFCDQPLDSAQTFCPRCGRSQT
jgi:hypothetical protein